MSIQEYIANKKKIQSAILSFINEEEEIEKKYQEMSTLLTDPTITTNKEELRQVILIISNISDNHHRTTNFFDKIGRIIGLIKNDIKNNFKNTEIFKIFKNNKRTLLLLVRENILTMNDQLISDIESLYSDPDDYFYDYPDIELIKEYFSPEFGYNISDTVESFNANREKGENDSYICELIRQDSIEDFIIYVHKNGINLNSQINESVFETNSFLIEKKTLLIEYSAFYGSIQIFNYIKNNNPELLKSDLWLYAIHSNNPEMINLLEENKVLPNYQTYVECMVESIKCHHNEIANYIRETLYDKNSSKGTELVDFEIKKGDFQLNKCPIVSHNFEFIPDDNESIYNMIFYFIENEYSQIVKLVNDQYQFIFDINDYEKVEEFGNPLFESFITQKKGTQERCLIKTIIDKHYSDELTRIMCRYPSILSIKGFCPIDFDQQQRATILTDYYDFTLTNYIQKKKDEEESYTKTNDYIIILGITIGLRYLQKRGIAHEALFPDSILLDENLYPIIANLDLSKRLLVNIGMADIPELHGSYFYSPPESASGYEFATSNVFSYSFTLYYLLTKRHPFEGRRVKSPFRALRDISDGYRPSTDMIDSEIIVDFLTTCWDQNPNGRLTFDEILDAITNEEFYSYFEQLDHESVKKYLDIYGSEFDEIKKKF